MFKVLLVDDEAIIRKGIKNIINWTELGCFICGEAGDGIDGMNKIRELKPDIIITDIRMPGIDGLDMIKETKKIIPETKILLLTGYRNFEYIQKAIKLGAFDYILKPSKIEDITTAIKKAVEELNNEKLKEEEVRRLKRNLEEQGEVVKQKLLYDLLFNINLRTERVEEEMKLCGLVIKDFMIVTIDNNTSKSNSISKENLVYKEGIIKSFLDVFKEKFYTEFLIVSENRIVFIVQPFENIQNIIEEVEIRLQSFREIVCGCFEININTVVSSIGSGFLALSEKMAEVMNKIDNADFHNNIKRFNKSNENLTNSPILEKNVEEESIRLALRKAIDFIKNNYRNSITLNDVAEHTYVSTYYLSRLFTKEIGKSFVDYLNDIRIQKAKEYLRKNTYKTYEVAELVGIRDAHYFSKLFKKYTGSTPSEFKEKL